MPGALTTAAGGGAETVAAAIRIGVGVLATATTETPEVPGERSTAATRHHGGVTGRRVARGRGRADGAGQHERGEDRGDTESRHPDDLAGAAPRCPEGRSSPYVHSTVLAV